MADGAVAPGRPAQWVARRGLWARGLLLAALGAGAGLGQAPFGWPVATILALALVVFLAQQVAAARAAFGIGCAFGTGYFALTLHWITQPFLVEPARDGWMAPFALVLMAGGLALFWGAALAGAAWLAPANGAARRAAIVALWTGAEAARSLILTGFPWALLGHVWIDTPLAQLAAWGGPHGLTLVTLALAAVVAGIGLRVWLAAPAAVVAGLWLVLDPGPPPLPETTAPIVRLVQPNVPQAQKWDPDLMAGHFRRLLALTSQGGPVDLIVWPETAVPYLLEYSDEVLEMAAIAAQGAPLLLGIQRREGESRFFNSLILLGPDAGLPARAGARADAVYDKAHLVPFGEYMPLGEVMARVGIHGLAASEGGGYSAGPGPVVIAVPGIGLAMPLICYESIFAEEVAAAPQRPRLLVLITNDAWFGTFAGPFQHFEQARLRAIEQGLPMVRVANTGVSGLIDGQGRVLGRIALGQAGALDVALPSALPPTVYARLGDAPVLGLLGLALLALTLARRKKAD